MPRCVSVHRYLYASVYGLFYASVSGIVYGLLYASVSVCVVVYFCLVGCASAFGVLSLFGVVRRDALPCLSF